jgi:uncharacterized protein YceH (UPF0502 family)
LHPRPGVRYNFPVESAHPVRFQRAVARAAWKAISYPWDNMDMCLSEVEARVLGCLIEKERTTPEYYPLSRNSLTAACNQKSNRFPVMELTEADVDRAIETLRYTHRLTAQVTLAGSRIVRFRHELLTHFQFSPEECAVLCELLLRGPQTAGELRTHTQRMVNIDTPAAVKAVLDSLMHWGETAFVVKLPPRPGNREERYAHLFSGEPQITATETAADTCQPAPTTPTDERIKALEDQIAALGARLAVLENALL